MQDSLVVPQAPRAPSAFAGVLGARLTPGGLTWWRWGLGVPAAAGQGMPGCLRGQGELPGASRDSQGPKLSCRVDTNPLRDNVSSGYHSGSCSAAEAFHWEMQHQKSMLLDSKWLWNSCTGAAK